MGDDIPFEMEHCFRSKCAHQNCQDAFVPLLGVATNNSIECKRKCLENEWHIDECINLSVQMWWINGKKRKKVAQSVWGGGEELKCRCVYSVEVLSYCWLVSVSVVYWDRSTTYLRTLNMYRHTKSKQNAYYTQTIRTNTHWTESVVAYHSDGIRWVFFGISLCCW